MSRNILPANIDQTVLIDIKHGGGILTPIFFYLLKNYSFGIYFHVAFWRINSWHFSKTINTFFVSYSFYFIWLISVSGPEIPSLLLILFPAIERLHKLLQMFHKIIQVFHKIKLFSDFHWIIIFNYNTFVKLFLPCH